MHEIAYWGTDQEVKYLFSYFDSPNFLCRNAAFACMGIRRFDEAEEVMLGLFYKPRFCVGLYSMLCWP
jgi:hypothetical protein